MSSLIKTSPVEINEPDFEAKVLRSKVPVLVNFLRPKSEACRKFTPMMDEVAVDVADEARIYKVNLDANPDLGMWFGIQFVPTPLYFFDGDLKAKMVGITTKKAILAKLQALTRFNPISK
jgi:thioredoxin 1